MVELLGPFQIGNTTTILGIFGIENGIVSVLLWTKNRTDISVHSHNKPNNITINNSVLLGYTLEQNKAEIKRYLLKGLILLIK